MIQMEWPIRSVIPACAEANPGVPALREADELDADDELHRTGRARGRGGDTCSWEQGHIGQAQEGVPST